LPEKLCVFHLQQFHDGHRVEEVQAAKALFVLQLGRNVGQLEGGRVRGHHGVAGNVGFHFGEQLLLGLHILHDSFDYQVGLGDRFPNIG